MAGRKENLKALFTNSRSRVIIFFTVIVLAIAVIVGFIKMSSHLKGAVSSVSLSPGPVDIQSVPGSNPTEQYATLQQAQNISQAEQALKKGGSSIPTIVRTQAFDGDLQSIGPQKGEGGVGFATLARESQGGTQQDLWLQSLKDANCSKASVASVIAEGGQLVNIKKVCSCAQLKDNGYQFADLKPICACKDLKAAGFNARQMKDAGSTAAQLRECGFDACEMRAAGFTAQDMKDGGYSDGELKGAGFPENDIEKASGIPSGMTADDIRKAGCDVSALSRLRISGVGASAIRQISGCTTAQLKAAGFAAKDLKNAGFSAADLLKAGFKPTDLKSAGFGARELMDAGVTPADLLAAGFTPDEVKAAEGQLPTGMTADDIKKAGCGVAALKRERLAGVSALLIHKFAGCRANALKNAGFTDDDLTNAGFTPKDIAAAKGLDDATIKSAACDPQKLKTLHDEGVTALRIHELNDCSASALKDAGYSAKDLLDAGFTPQQLVAAGFNPGEIAAAEKASDDAIKAAGCDPEKLKGLHDQGVSAKRIRDLNGCSLSTLKDAGYGAKELAAAGFTPQQLTAAGFGLDPLNKAEAISDGAIKAAACESAPLKKLFEEGVSAKRIHDLNGCSASALKAAGYNAQQSADAGFTPQELLAAGFSPDDLKAAGLSPSGVIAAGRVTDCSVASLQAAHALGVSALTIKNTLGCNAKQLKDGGYLASELKAAGFTAAEMKQAGFSPADLKGAGFSAKELADAGLSPVQLKNAGFGNSDLANGIAPLEPMAPISSGTSSLAGLEPNEKQKSLPSALMIPPLAASQSSKADEAEAESAKRLQEILKRQQSQMADQRYQQKIQERIAAKLSAATESIQSWKSIATQVYIGGNEEKKEAVGTDRAGIAGNSEIYPGTIPGQQNVAGGLNGNAAAPGIIKAGDILFAVLDTSVNTDEPGPILATIVSGKLNGTKLIGSFNLPNNADKMVISFNTMSVPGASKTTSINAYAIDPNTARTALSSRTDHHYLMRYGSLFAATFLEGFGNAFQSANTTVTIGGVGDVSNTTISNGVGRSTLENAVIGLATLGKAWGQVAQQQFSRPTTVELYSGTGIGVLFTQDLQSI